MASSLKTQARKPRKKVSAEKRRISNAKYRQKKKDAGFKMKCKWTK